MSDEQQEWISCAPDSSWLGDTLSEAFKDEDLEVLSIDAVGTGQVAGALRIKVKDNQSNLSAYVAKVPSEDEQTREKAIASGTYLREVKFYEKLAQSSLISVPKIKYSFCDRATGLFILLMEDLAPAEQGNQLVGCSLEQAEIAMTEIAKLGGTSWNNESALSYRWMGLRFSDLLNTEVMKGLWQVFLAKHPSGFSSDETTLIDGFIDRFDTYSGHTARKQCLVHNDYRIDNMLFQTEKGGRPITVVDWQTVSAGAAAFDVAYFIGTSVPLELRRENEKSLVERYWLELEKQGVTGYDFEQCWEDYCIFSFSGFVMAVVASATVADTDRGDEMFLTMAKGSLQLAADHDALGLISA